MWMQSYVPNVVNVGEYVPTVLLFLKKIKLLLTSLNAGIAGHVLTTAHSRQYIQKMLRGAAQYRGPCKQLAMKLK